MVMVPFFKHTVYLVKPSDRNTRLLRSQSFLRNSRMPFAPTLTYFCDKKKLMGQKKLMDGSPLASPASHLPNLRAR